MNELVLGHSQTLTKFLRFLRVFMYFRIFLKRNTSKYILNLLHLSVVIILKTDLFPIFPGTPF